MEGRPRRRPAAMRSRRPPIALRRLIPGGGPGFRRPADSDPMCPRAEQAHSRTCVCGSSRAPVNAIAADWAAGPIASSARAAASRTRGSESLRSPASDGTAEWAANPISAIAPAARARISGFGSAKRMHPEDQRLSPIQWLGVPSAARGKRSGTERTSPPLDSFAWYAPLTGPSGDDAVASSSGWPIAHTPAGGAQPRAAWTASTNARALPVMVAQSFLAIASLGNRADPTPIATAPARIQSATFFNSTPPVGMSFTCGSGARTSLKYAGPSPWRERL